MEKFVTTREIMKGMRFPRWFDLPPNQSFMNTWGYSLAFPFCIYFIVEFFTAWLLLPSHWSSKWSPKSRNQHFLTLTLRIYSLSSLIVNSVKAFFENYNLYGTLYSDFLTNNLFSRTTSPTFISRWFEITIFHYKHPWLFFFPTEFELLYFPYPVIWEFIPCAVLLLLVWKRNILLLLFCPMFFVSQLY